MPVTRYMFMFLLLSTMFFAAACDSDGDDDPTDLPSGEVLETSVDIPTAVDVIEPTSDLGTSPTSDVTEMTMQTPAGSDMYTLTVSDVATDNFDMEMEDPASGMKWVVVDVMISSMAGAEATEVSSERVFLIDTDGNRYNPEAPDADMPSPLTGEELAEGSSLEGSLVFSIPEDATPAIIEWCLDDTCTQTAQAIAGTE